MANFQNSINLLDDVDLFSNITMTNDIMYQNRSQRTNSLIDAPVPTLDWHGFYSTPPQSAAPILTNSALLLDTDFVEQWPEVPSVQTEHRVHMSSTSSTSSQKDQGVQIRQNGPISSTKTNGFMSTSPTNKDLLFRSDSAPVDNTGSGLNRLSKQLNTSGLALPPRIEQRKAVLGSAPPIGVPNGFTATEPAQSSVRYQKLSSTSTGFDQYGELDGYLSKELQTSSDAKSTKGFQQINDEDEEEDDEVFLHIGSQAAERASVLAPLTGAKKKKVRFFEDGQMETELLVGSLPASAQNNPSTAAIKKGRSCRPRLIWLTLVLAILLALAATVIFIIFIPWRRGNVAKKAASMMVRSKGSCERMDVEYLGNTSVDGIFPTSALTLICLKKSDCKDTIVFGYGSTDVVPCYGSSECRGGVAAIDMTSGDLAWRRSALGEVNGINCRDDLNGDGIVDCLASGKRGVLVALNGKTGEPVWEFDTGVKRMEAEFFMPQMVPDMDNDGVPEVLVTMVIRSDDNMRLYFLSGKTGKAYLKHTPIALNLQNIDTVVPSMIWKHGEALPDVVISAGSFYRRGGVSVYAIQSFLLMRLEKGKLIYNNSVLTPPVFADVNGDSYGDMVFCTSAGELMAVDGASSGGVLWRYKAPQAECASPLTIGFYNGDAIPDIAATFCFGDGFPMYRYCETVFVNGRTGQELKEARRVRSTLPNAISGLSVRTNSNAGDVFLFWKTTCGGLEANLNYRFLDVGPSSWRDYSWANICLQLTGKAMSHQLLAVGAGMPSPTVIFDSGTRNFNEEEEKFVSLLTQQDASVSYMATGKVASVRIGPAGAFTVGKNGGTAYLDLVLPTFISVAYQMAVAPLECIDPESCGTQFERMTRQTNRVANVDSGGLLLHKIRLRCSCTGPSNTNCAEIISDNKYQSWSEYLGSNSDGRFLI